MSLLLPVALALGALAAPGLAAQSRGGLQVAVRVVPVRPHLEALAEVRALLGPALRDPAPGAGRRTLLASIRSEALPGRSKAGRVVTVSFLRN